MSSQRRLDGVAGAQAAALPAPEQEVCADTHCITCSDEGVPMRVVATPEDGVARCEAAGAESDVMIDLVGTVVIGDELLVHAGAALARVA